LELFWDLVVLGGNVDIVTKGINKLIVQINWLY